MTRRLDADLFLWRLVAERYADRAFDGEGARLYGGRWNLPGTPAVYTSTHLSLAVLELFVHLDPADAPEEMVTIPARVPAGTLVDELDVADLPGGWRSYPAPEAVQQLGTDRLAAGKAAVLLVPSVVIPAERNAVLDPRHADFTTIEIGEPEEFSFDPRMWK
ncbi:MAG TPA: RES family NAD+ phosphorylase [Thermoanaerobaculia bacterium]|nr:RES family NAD+ phosphorylase [Thermoanaerobaculia bacterium]